jgi:hypothetical protein
VSYVKHRSYICEVTFTMREVRQSAAQIICQQCAKMCDLAMYKVDLFC